MGVLCVANGDGHPTSQAVDWVCVDGSVMLGFYGCPFCCVFCCALINIIFKINSVILKKGTITPNRVSVNQIIGFDCIVMNHKCSGIL